MKKEKERKKGWKALGKKEEGRKRRAEGHTTHPREHNGSPHIHTRTNETHTLFMVAFLERADADKETHRELVRVLRIVLSSRQQAAALMMAVIINAAGANSGFLVGASAVAAGAAAAAPKADAAPAHGRVPPPHQPPLALGDHSPANRRSSGGSGGAIALLCCCRPRDCCSFRSSGRQSRHPGREPRPALNVVHIVDTLILVLGSSSSTSSRSSGSVISTALETPPLRQHEQHALLRLKVQRCSRATLLPRFLLVIMVMKAMVMVVIMVRAGMRRGRG